jgi:hypothetical protein
MFTGYRYWSRKSQAYPERLEHFPMKSFESLIVKRRNKYRWYQESIKIGWGVSLRRFVGRKKKFNPPFHVEL